MDDALLALHTLIDYPVTAGSAPAVRTVHVTTLQAIRAALVEAQADRDRLRAERDTMQLEAERLAEQLHKKFWELLTLTAPEAIGTMYNLKITPLLDDLQTLAADAADRVQEAPDEG